MAIQGSKTRFLNELLEKKCEYKGYCEIENQYMDCAEHIYCPVYQDQIQAGLQGCLFADDVMEELLKNGCKRW